MSWKGKVHVTNTRQNLVLNLPKLIDNTPSRQNQSPKQILLSIAQELSAKDIAKEQVEALLTEAKMLIWMEFDDLDNNILKKEIDVQIDALSKYNWQKSQNKKDLILKHVIADTVDSIKYYYTSIAINEQ